MTNQMNVRIFHVFLGRFLRNLVRNNKKDGLMLDLKTGRTMDINIAALKINHAVGEACQ